MNYIRGVEDFIRSVIDKLRGAKKLQLRTFTSGLFSKPDDLLCPWGILRLPHIHQTFQWIIQEHRTAQKICVEWGDSVRKYSE